MSVELSADAIVRTCPVTSADISPTPCSLHLVQLAVGPSHHNMNELVQAIQIDAGGKDKPAGQLLVPPVHLIPVVVSAELRILFLYSGFSERIARASSKSAISLPISLAMATTLDTSLKLSAGVPFGM